MTTRLRARVRGLPGGAVAGVRVREPGRPRYDRRLVLLGEFERFPRDRAERIARTVNASGTLPEGYALEPA